MKNTKDVRKDFPAEEARKYCTTVSQLQDYSLSKGSPNHIGVAWVVTKPSQVR